jgi:hypothetical protein
LHVLHFAGAHVLQFEGAHVLQLEGAHVLQGLQLEQPESTRRNPTATTARARARVRYMESILLGESAGTGADARDAHLGASCAALLPANVGRRD